MAEGPHQPRSGETPIDRARRAELRRADARTTLEQMLDLYLLDVPAETFLMGVGSRSHTTYRRPLYADRLIPIFEAYASPLVEVDRNQTPALSNPTIIFNRVMETCRALKTRTAFDPLFETNEFRRRVREACLGQHTIETGADDSADSERLLRNKANVSVMIAAKYLAVTTDHVLRLIRDGKVAATNMKPKKISTESLRKYKHPSFKQNPT
jgi:hypothetical protein